MNLLSVQLKSLQRKIIMCSDSALYAATYFSQNMVPQQSGCTGQQVCLLHWTEAWILLGNNSRLVSGTIKICGTRDHQNCIIIRPRSHRGFQQFFFWDFNWSMTGDLRECSSLLQHDMRIVIHHLCVHPQAHDCLNEAVISVVYSKTHTLWLSLFTSTGTLFVWMKWWYLLSYSKTHTL